MTLLKQTAVARADDNLTRLEKDDDLQTDCCTFSLTDGSLEKELQTLTLKDTQSSKSELSCESGIASFSANYSVQSENSDLTDLPAKQSAPASIKYVETKTEPLCVSHETRLPNDGEKVMPHRPIPTDVQRPAKEHRKQKEKVGKIVDALPDDVCHSFPDKDGDTLLHLAVLQTVTHLAQFVQLLGLHGQVNCRNRLYQTPLHLAVLTGNSRALTLLRTLGASLCLQDCHGNTPLHTACLRNDPHVLRLLLHGEEVDAGNEKLETPPSGKCEGSDCLDSNLRGVGYLSQKRVGSKHGDGSDTKTGYDFETGCDEPESDDERKTLTGLEEVEEEGDSERQRRVAREVKVALCLKNYEGFTCLHLAVLHGRADLVAVLLQNGADINARDAKSGRTALHLAVDTVHPSSPILSTLLLHPQLHINATNFAQQTALQLARGRRHLDLVDLLHMRGARWSDSIHGYYSSDSFSEEDAEDDLFVPYDDLRVAGQLLSTARCSC